jgi:hypothetical protein
MRTIKIGDEYTRIIFMLGGMEVARIISDKSYGVLYIPKIRQTKHTTTWLILPNRDSSEGFIVCKNIGCAINKLKKLCGDKAFPLLKQVKEGTSNVIKKDVSSVVFGQLNS